MNLWNLKKGEQAVINGFDVNLEEHYLTRLNDLGLLLGEIITCVMTPGLGAPSVFQLQNSVYSLDKNISQKILIEKVNPHE